MKEQNKPIQIKLIDIGLLEENVGQLAGLPSNPREIADERFELLKSDIQKYPEFLNVNALKVYPLDNGKYIVIGGNMRYRALLQLGYAKVPCVIIPQETPVEDLKAYTVLDNSGFGSWDWTKLSSEEWDSAQLQEWGVDVMEELDVDMSENVIGSGLDKSSLKVGKDNETTLKLKFDCDTYALVIEELERYDEDMSVAILKVLGIYGE